MKKANKYKAKKVAFDGHTFDSTAEMVVYKQLKFRLMCGSIKDLRLQVKYELRVYGTHIADYVSDFVYTVSKTGKVEVVDVKSSYTAKLPAYRIKKKLLKACHGIEIVEVVV